jgi:hypothetical protein
MYSNNNIIFVDLNGVKRDFWIRTEITNVYFLRDSRTILSQKKLQVILE